MVALRLYCTGELVISTRRRRLLTIRDMVEALERGEGPRTTSELTAILAYRLEDLDTARDRAGVAYEELTSRLAEQMNTRMYVLSLIAGLFLPLGFPTGLLGVNVGGIPLADDPMGFLEVVAFMLLMVLIQIVVFRHKKWFYSGYAIHTDHSYRHPKRPHSRL